MAKTSAKRKSGSGAAFEGIWAVMGPVGTAPAKARELAAALVKRMPQGPWRIVPAGERTREVHFLYEGKARNTTAKAWDLVNTIRSDRDVVEAGPLFEIGGFGEEPAPKMPRGLRASGMGGEAHLACSAPFDWALQSCGFPAAWALPPDTGGAAKGAGIVIGHPDTGYTDHPQLVNGGRVDAGVGWDFVADRADPRDPLTGTSASHGTSTGSIIMSELGDTQGGGPVTGAAPRATLIPLRVTDFVGLFSYGRLARAIRHAVDHGAHVISISLGGLWSDGSLLRALQYARDNGVIIVAASGNHVPVVVYPARYEECVAVCATNCQDTVWSGASTGDDVDISAPGESVWRARVEKGLQIVARGEGTSYATALMAGAAACWLAHHGRDKLVAKYGLANVSVVFKEVLMTSGARKPSGWDTSAAGAGIADVKALLQAPLPATARASGFRRLLARGPAPRKSPLEVVAGHLPGVSAVSLRKALAKQLATTDAGLDRALAEHVDEISFHVATDPSFRAALSPVAVRARLAAAPAPRPPALSRALRKSLAG